MQALHAVHVDLNQQKAAVIGCTRWNNMLRRHGSTRRTLHNDALHVYCCLGMYSRSTKTTRLQHVALSLRDETTMNVTAGRRHTRTRSFRPS